MTARNKLPSAPTAYPIRARRLRVLTALDGAKEHEREEARRHDPEGEPPVPSLEDLRERARQPEGATSLEDRHARREAADHDVHDSAREEPEARERMRDSLLRPSRLRGHARDSRRSHGTGDAKIRSGPMTENLLRGGRRHRRRGTRRARRRARAARPRKVRPPPRQGRARETRRPRQGVVRRRSPHRHAASEKVRHRRLARAGAPRLAFVRAVRRG